MIIEQNHKII